MLSEHTDIAKGDALDATGQLEHTMPRLVQQTSYEHQCRVAC